MAAQQYYGRGIALPKVPAPTTVDPNAPVTTATQAPPAPDQPVEWDSSATVQGAPQEQPAPAPLAPRFDKTIGFDPTKWDSGHDSPKYQVGRTISQFDARQGLTPEVISALQGLGLGDVVRVNDQKVRFDNADPRFEGITEFDLIQGWQGGQGANPTWQFHNANEGAVPDASGFLPPATSNTSAAYGSGSSYTQGGGAATTSVDPFEAMGGGVRLANGDWVPRDHPLASGAKWQGGGSTGSTTSTTTAGNTRPAEIEEAYRNEIMRLLRTPQTVDPNELRNSPEMQAVQLQAQRAEERDRAHLAERASAGGWSGSGGFEGGVNAIREQRGATEMNFIGQLAVQRMEQQRADIARGLEAAMNDQQFGLAQNLQRELANLDAAIQREQIAANVGMNDAELATRQNLGTADLDLRRYLGQQDLGYNYAALQLQANRDAMTYGAGY